jgi:hypothetical protein
MKVIKRIWRRVAIAAVALAVRIRQESMVFAGWRRLD